MRQQHFVSSRAAETDSYYDLSECSLSKDAIATLAASVPYAKSTRNRDNEVRVLAVQTKVPSNDHSSPSQSDVASLTTAAARSASMPPAPSPAGSRNGRPHTTCGSFTTHSTLVVVAVHVSALAVGQASTQPATRFCSSQFVYQS